MVLFSLKTNLKCTTEKNQINKLITKNLQKKKIKLCTCKSIFDQLLNPETLNLHIKVLTCPTNCSMPNEGQMVLQISFKIRKVF